MPIITALRLTLGEMGVANDQHLYNDRLKGTQKQRDQFSELRSLKGHFDTLTDTEIEQIKCGLENKGFVLVKHQLVRQFVGLTVEWEEHRFIIGRPK